MLRRRPKGVNTLGCGDEDCQFPAIAAFALLAFNAITPSTQQDYAD